MTNGVLLFAFNNAEINYIKMAEYAAKKIEHFLKVPVTIVTDEDSAKTITYNFDNIIVNSEPHIYKKTFRDGSKTAKRLEWKNTARHLAYELSPYDGTLVLDVDYIINSEVLNYCWDQPNDFLIYRKSFDISQWRDTSNFTKVSDYSIPFYWATAFYFKKTESVKAFFTLLAHVKENWQYYKFLYTIDSGNFRNDYAFSIAIHILNGFTNGDFAKDLPGKMYYSLDKDILVKSKNRSFYFLVEEQNKPDKYFPLKVSNMDIHVMNKYSLSRIIDNE